MVDVVRQTLRERIACGATIDEIDFLIRMSRGLSERERESLWTFAWGYTPERRESRFASPRTMTAGRPQPLH
jgi:hypothetical protein